MIGHLIERTSNWRMRPQFCAFSRKSFLLVAVLGLLGQVLYDSHALVAVSIFPQWFLLAAIWYAWREGEVPHNSGARDALILGLLIPLLSCLSLLVSWFGWKANTMAICGVIPISDSASYYISAQTFLRDAFLDAAGQRRPLNILLTSVWMYFSGDNFKLLLLVQALGFSAAAFLASAVAASIHGFRAGLLLFGFLLVFAEPYLPTMLSETNGITFGMLALVGFIFGLYRRSFLAFCLGAFLLSVGLAIRPSALLVLPCVVAAGSVIFGTSRIKRLVVVVTLTAAVLLPNGISIVLNDTMSHRDGALNGNLSYVVYGLVTGGKGWEQYQKDNPGRLDGLPEAERSQIILEASRRHFKEHPGDLIRGLIEGQVQGPLQTFAQVVRLSFLGAAGDPLRIIRPVVIIVISVLFAGVLCCQLISRRGGLSTQPNHRLFFILFLIGYLASIPFFYKDGGLRLHAAVLPILSYVLVWVLLPATNASRDVPSISNGDRLFAGTVAFSSVLLGLLVWIVLAHPKSHDFDAFPTTRYLKENEIMFRFKPGWPKCDLRKFERARGDDKPRWFSGAITDDNYRSAGIRGISGYGDLYFGFDGAARVWKIIHTNQPVGLLNRVDIVSGYPEVSEDKQYRDFYSVRSVEIVGAQSVR